MKQVLGVNRQSAICAVSLLVNLAACGSVANNGLLFRATFDTGLDADHSAGSPTPSATNVTSVTANGGGRSGEAVFIGDGDYLIYESRANCNSRAGMVVAWVKPELTTPTDSMAGRYFFHLHSDAGDIVLFVYGEGDQSRIVLHTRRRDGKIANLEGPFKVPIGWKDQWHEVGFSYDLDEGLAKIVVDGRVIAAGDAAKQITLPEISDDGFFIGVGCNVNNHLSNLHGYVDDFRIYSTFTDYMVDRAL